MTTSVLQIQQLIMAASILHSMLWTQVAGVYHHPCNHKYTNLTTAKNNTRLWPAGVVVYKMNISLSKNVCVAVEEQMKRWELHSCIKFVPYANLDQKTFILFEPGDKNCAFFGLIGSGAHRVSLAESISTNQTALNAIFARMIGIRNSNSVWLPEKPSHHGAIPLTNSSLVTMAQSKKCDEMKACGNIIMINSDEGLKHHLITSPGYPHGYEGNLDCVWSIYNADRRLINISFTGSSFEEACYDYVDIITTDEEGDLNPGWKRLCKSKDMERIISTNKYRVVIHFHSDVVKSGKGLIANITWRELPSIDECTLDNGGCEHECVPASVTNSSTRTCRCNPGFELHEDDGVSCKDVDECQVNKGGCPQICVNRIGTYYCKCRIGHTHNPDDSCQRCHKIYTDQKNVIIHSPQYPRVYSAGHNCVWKIRTKTPHFFKVTISSFNLTYSSNCTLGYLKITDKMNKLKLKRLCGVHHKVVIISRTSELIFHFKSKVRGGTGFYLTYKQVAKQRRYIEIDGETIQNKLKMFKHTTYAD